MITHEEYQNLVASEDDPYLDAIRHLPDEDQDEYYKMNDKCRCLSDAFQRRLAKIDQSSGSDDIVTSLVKEYLRVEEARNNRNSMMADAMYLKGILEEHADLRMQGWIAPD